MGEAKSKKTSDLAGKSSIASTSSLNVKKSSSSAPVAQVTYGPKQFRYVFIGLGLLIIGFLLMSGGSMPSPDVWDESIIYGFRRTVAAPIFLIAGLIVQIWAIFKI